MRGRVVSALVVVAALCFGVALVAGASSPPASATALEAGLLAPCCWGGTLDTHDSDIARDLRHEIEARSSRGESIAAIHDDLIGRYGSQMEAMPTRRLFAFILAGAVLAGALATLVALRAVRRWTAPASAGPGDPDLVASPTARDDLDGRLDAELERMD